MMVVVQWTRRNYCVNGQQKNNDSKWDLMPIDPDLCPQIQICDQDNDVLLINEAEKI